MWFLTVLDFFRQIAIIIFFFDLFILLPLCIFHKTRLFAAKGILYSGWFFGFVVWIISVGYTFSHWGIIALIIGLLILGVGVVPMAFLATLIAGLWSGFFELLIISIVAIVFQQLGGIMIDRWGSWVWE